MKHKKQISPAPYPANSTEELSATTVFKSLIDLIQIKPDIKELDKFPNIDGYLELTDTNQYPIGKLEVQIKKLGDKRTSKPSYQIGLEFLSYCKNITSLPVLLVVVDVKNKSAYWKNITETIASELIEKAKGKSIVIHFNIELDIIDSTKKEYLDKWIEISHTHRNKIISYDALKKMHDSDKVTLAELKKYIINPTGEINDKFPALYRFIDFYNYLLDYDFRSIKKVLYENVWKIGIAYTDFDYNNLAYVLYEINKKANDTLIKVLKNIKANNVGFDHIRMAAMNYNPILNVPQNHAYKIVYDDLEKLLALKAFLIVNNSIANEYLFNLINCHHWLFGINKSSLPKSYDLAEFKTLVFDRWINILFDLKFKFHTDEHLEKSKELTVSLDDLISQFKGREKELKVLLNKNSSNRFIIYKDKIVLTSRSYDIWFIKRCVQSLESNNETHIKMLYRRPDLKNELGVVWGGYSRKNIFANLQVIFKNFINSYHQYLQTYFPLLLNDFKFFKDYDTLVVILGHIDITNVYPPKISIVKYSTKRRQVGPTIEFYLEENLPTKYQDYWGAAMIKENPLLEWRGMSGISFRYVFNNLPLDNYLYDHISKTFKEYFKQKKEDSDIPFEPFL